MKKAITLVLIGCMILSMAACGGKETPTEAPTAPSTEAPTVPPTEATTEAPTVPPTEATTEAPTPTETQEDELGAWKVQQTVDEFGDVTEDSKTVVTTLVEGSFSNTATSNSDLAVVVYMSIYGGDKFYYIKDGHLYTQTVQGDYPYFSFRLLEYNDHKATYTDYDSIAVKTKIDDTIFEFNEVMSAAPNGDLTICDTWETTYNALYSGKDVRCIITIGSSQYNFTLSAKKFVDAVKEGDIITETVFFNEADDEAIYQKANKYAEAENYSKAIELLEHIKSYKNSQELITLYNNKIEEAKVMTMLLNSSTNYYYSRKNYINEHWADYEPLTAEELKAIIVGKWTTPGNIKNATYTFKADGTYSYYWDGTTDKGTWKCEGNYLIVVSSKGGSSKEIYRHIKDNAYVATYEDKNGQTKAYVTWKEE